MLGTPLSCQNKERWNFSGHLDVYATEFLISTSTCREVGDHPRILNIRFVAHDGLQAWNRADYLEHISGQGL